ncbi:MAG TPA: prepilin-type N-terminal cleavage/methylation domain-containing protein [Candidatus Saccharimonadales bacterium]|jgi:type II secretory pathway pseudopilin PulG|nr:prepilin-type N-terminal cleavage/methylation domain-containing protein [Candidatus Saccharimonadales bacterium]
MRITRWAHERSEQGDTIVEVLIAIAVVSLVLGGAYVTTNRSLQATRGAQEQGNAIKLTESQLEQMKGVSVTDATSIFGGSTPASFCMNNNTVVDASQAACTVDTAGNPTSGVPAYHLKISRGSDGHTFTVTNTWDDVGGKAVDNIQMEYRLYQ